MNLYSNFKRFPRSNFSNSTKRNFLDKRVYSKSFLTVNPKEDLSKKEPLKMEEKMDPLSKVFISLLEEKKKTFEVSKENRKIFRTKEDGKFIYFKQEEEEEEEEEDDAEIEEIVELYNQIGEKS